MDDDSQRSCCCCLIIICFFVFSNNSGEDFGDKIKNLFYGFLLLMLALSIIGAIFGGLSSGANNTYVEVDNQTYFVTYDPPIMTNQNYRIDSIQAV